MERNTNTGFKCPYSDLSCVHINTCGMSVDKSCQECDFFHSRPQADRVMYRMKKLINKNRRDMEKLILENQLTIMRGLKRLLYGNDKTTKDIQRSIKKTKDFLDLGKKLMEKRIKNLDIEI